MFSCAKLCVYLFGCQGVCGILTQTQNIGQRILFMEFLTNRVVTQFMGLWR